MPSPWAVALGGVALLAVLGVGLLSWSRTDGGRAALLRMGSEDQFGPVQAAVDSALTHALPAFTPGPAAAAGDDSRRCDHPADDGSGTSIFCRAVPVPAGMSFWEAELAVAEAVAPCGARVLWGERMERPRGRWQRRPEGEAADVLRLDVGVVGRPTHTLLLYGEADGPPPVCWDGGVVSDEASDLLGESGAPTIAIVVDDWGNVANDATRTLLRMDVPLTLSVLPGRPFTRRYALCATDLAVPDEPAAAAAAPGRGDPAAWARRERAERGCMVEIALGGGRAREVPQRRREVILHLPMEPQAYPEVDPGRLAVMKGMDQRAIEDVVEESLRALPGVTGVNNHMGSAATADRPTMERLMKVLSGRGLFFLDSRTTARSVAAEVASEAGIRTLSNRRFLDQKVTTVEVVRANLARLIRDARNSDSGVIGICHPYPETVAVLREELPRLRREGVRLVTLSELLALRAERGTRLAAR